MFKKIIISLLITSIFLTSLASVFVKPTYAVGEWYNPSFQEFHDKVYSTDTPPQEIFGERYTAAQVNWIIWSLLSFIIEQNIPAGVIPCIFQGGDVPGCADTYGLLSNNAGPITPQTEQKSVLATLFSHKRNPSFVNYTREKLASLKVVPEANAQGFGFAALNPVQSIWKAFRNLAFGLMVIITLILAFMIMFRVRLSPQTVIGVQTAIPRVIFTIILISFSYAIAGFLIDLTYVAIGLVALIFQSTGFLTTALGDPIGWSHYFTILTDGPEKWGGGIFGWMVALLQVVVVGAAGMFWGATGFAGIIQTAGSYLLAAILLFVFIVLALMVIFKALFMLIKAYVLVILSVIFAPLQIGAGALVPAVGFGSWAKKLAANLAIYPITGVILMLATMFIAGAYTQTSDDIADVLVTGSVISSPFGCDAASPCDFWYPPLTVGTQTGNFDPLPFLFIIAGLGTIALIPQAATMAQGIAVGKGIEAGLAGGAAALQQVGQKYREKAELERKAHIIRKNKDYVPNQPGPKGAIQDWYWSRQAAKGIVRPK